MTLAQRLDGIPGFHHLIRLLRVRQVVGFFLKLVPLVKTLPGSGVKYRRRYLETFFLADEFFTRNAYSKVIDPKATRTFVDLGCNAGLFAALLAHETGRRDLKGLMIDANPEMVEESSWLLKTNQLTGIKVLHGLVGASKAGTDKAEFFILPSNLGSSQFPVYEPGKPPKGDWTKVTVSNIDLEQAWVAHVGDVRCDLLKVDIEGSEKHLFRNEAAFMRRVDRVVLEWHKWIVSRGEVEQDLHAAGLKLVEVLQEEETSGIAWYQRVG
jgi:FkbM family methyltransferase